MLQNCKLFRRTLYEVEGGNCYENLTNFVTLNFPPRGEILERLFPPKGGTAICTVFRAVLSSEPSSGTDAADAEHDSGTTRRRKERTMKPTTTTTTATATATTAPAKQEKPTTDAFTFTATSMSVLGRTYDAGYSCDRNRHVYVFTSLCDVPLRLHFAPKTPGYDAAYKAAKAAKAAPIMPDPLAAKQPEAVKAPAKQEKPAAKPAAKQPEAPAKQEKPVTKPAAKQPKAPAKQEKPAAKPAAKQPEATKAPAKQEKPLVASGNALTGKGWSIVFDDETQRTRVMFAKQPTAAQKKAVTDAGFYWSAAMGSYNKRLTNKARRAAMALADTLKALTK